MSLNMWFIILKEDNILRENTERHICFFNFNFILFSMLDVLTTYIGLCMLYMLVAFKGQDRVLVPLELELKTVVNHHVGDRKQSWILWKHSQFS